MACKRCGLALNVYTLIPEGTRIWSHSRPSADLDHEPEPVPNTEVDVKFICDFCRAPYAPITYVGAELHRVRDVFGRLSNYSAIWSACVKCARHVDKARETGNTDDIVEYIRILQAAQQGVPMAVANQPEVARPNRAYLHRLYDAYIPTITERRVTPPPPPSMHDITPTKLPKMRDRLAKLWRDERFLSGLARTSADSTLAVPGEDFGAPGAFMATARPLPTDALGAFARRAEVGLTVADMYWISTNYTRMALSAGSKLDDLTVSREELPAANGFIVWQQPIAQVENRSGFCDVIAASWTLVPDGVWIVLHVRSEQYLGNQGPIENLQRMREDIGWFAPVSTGSGLRFGTSPALNAGDDSPARQAVATLIATWILLDQENLTEITEEQPDKAVRKAYARQQRPIPTVRVVDILKRTPKAAKKTDDTETTASTRAPWSYRLIVGGKTGGFIRHYWHGPGKTQRKRRWIDPYIAGPDDAPLKDDLDIQVVRALR